MVRGRKIMYVASTMHINPAINSHQTTHEGTQTFFSFAISSAQIYKKLSRDGTLTHDTLRDSCSTQISFWRGGTGKNISKWRDEIFHFGLQFGSVFRVLCVRSTLCSYFCDLILYPEENGTTFSHHVSRK